MHPAAQQYRVLYISVYNLNPTLCSQNTTDHVALLDSDLDVCINNQMGINTLTFCPWKKGYINRKQRHGPTAQSGVLGNQQKALPHITTLLIFPQAKYFSPCRKV